MVVASAMVRSVPDRQSFLDVLLLLVVVLLEVVAAQKTCHCLQILIIWLGMV
jgi:hypothetical protein